jgi:Thioredoxin-like
VKIFASIVAAGLVAVVADAQELSWTELAKRPELWPEQCTLKTTIKFDGGASIPTGQKVDVVDFKGEEVDLRTTDKRTYFAAESDETDVLDVAREAYAALTPKQRELTYPQLVQRKELWPYRVTIIRGFDLAPGKAVKAGDQVLVKDVQGGKVDVVSEKLNARFGVALSATDVMAQARKFVEDDQAGPRLLAMQKLAEDELAAEQKLQGEKIKAQGRVAVELEGRLINSATGVPEPLDTSAPPRYIVFLRGSTTCSITRSFTPTFVRYYNQIKEAHPELEVVYLTLDPLSDTEKFAQEMGFSWRSVSYERTTMPSVFSYIDGRIPQLIVMNRDGKVLANGIQSTAPAALQQLEALLRQPSVPN